ncbi:miraculin-like [Apium graveolens]|uniref:miraculin-like n=1 Tax=Apium graveolens TaxID=4045 RepID=UPI003D7A3F18
MKTTVILLSFLLIPLLNSLLIASAANDKVLDIDGQELRTGTNYYILPVVRGNGGGLKINSQGNYQCPLGVVQEADEVNRGTPMIFSPVNPDEQIVRESSDLNVKFSGPTFICSYKNNGEPTVWRIDSGDSGQTFVSLGGSVGDPGSSTIRNWFRIEKLEGGNNWYKFVYCPGVCNTCRPVCGDLGIVIEKSGTRRLALNTVKSFQVFFKKA